MAEWNPELYLTFEKQRTRPARDLALSVIDRNPKAILDLGCGPGNSTAVLREIFPEAEIVGIDSSEEMISKAKELHPGFEFRLCDVRSLSGSFDLLYSNACLQWIPDHKTLLPFLLKHLTATGTLAVQLPDNSSEPLYELISEMISDPKWSLGTIVEPQSRTLTVDEYHSILSGCASSFEIWQTRYFHVLSSHEELVDWVRGSRLRPYLALLDEDRREEFTAELLWKAENAYPEKKNGGVLFAQRRLFFTASK